MVIRLPDFTRVTPIQLAWIVNKFCQLYEPRN